MPEELDKFFDDAESSLGENEKFSDDQMAAFLTGSKQSGDDTDQDAGQADDEKKPEKTDEDPELEAKDKKAADDKVEGKAADQDDPGEKEKVVLAKDGEHTIPYSELEKARGKAEALSSQVDSLTKQLEIQQRFMEQFKAAQKEDEEAPGDETPVTDETLAEIREYDPDLANALEKYGMDRDNKISNLEKTINELNEKIEGLQQSDQKLAEDVHFDLITAAHSDFYEIRDSGKLTEWAEALPYKEGAAAFQIMEQGTPDQVIQLISAYKETTKAPDSPPAGDTAAKKKLSAEEIDKRAREAEEKAKQNTAPKSLSDLPASSTAPHDEAEALTQMDQLQLIDKMNAKGEAQDILDFMTRTM